MSNHNTVLYTETHDNGLTIIEVGQEWSGAGLYWQVRIENVVLGIYKQRSAGRFYMDDSGERIHGATLSEVIETAARGARTHIGIS